jgi:hypothetical protein
VVQEFHTDGQSKIKRHQRVATTPEKVHGYAANKIICTENRDYTIFRNDKTPVL